MNPERETSIHTGFELSEEAEADLYNLAMSEAAAPLMAAVKKHIKDNVEPIVQSVRVAQADEAHARA